MNSIDEQYREGLRQEIQEADKSTEPSRRQQRLRQLLDDCLDVDNGEDFLHEAIEIMNLLPLADRPESARDTIFKHFDNWDQPRPDI
jgi:hypothetical protein